MKKFLSFFTAAVFSAVLAAPCLSELSADGAEAADNFTLSYTFSDSGAEVTGFSGSVTKLEIPSVVGDIQVVSIASGAFSEAPELTSVTIPDSIASIGDRAFWNCSQLSTISLGSGVSEIGSYAFSACPSLSAFEVSSKNEYFSDEDGMLFSKDKKVLLYYAGDSDAEIPDGTVSLGKAAFFGNSKLASVSFPTSLEIIGDYAFSGCFSLSEIVLPSNVKSLGKGSFMNCSSLVKAVLGNGITAIPDECFSMCNILTAVNITSSVREIGNEAFFSCHKLSGIEIPANVEKIGTDAVGTYYNILNRKNLPVPGFYISGKKGSYAERYAKNCGVDFIDFSDIHFGDIDGNGVVDASDASSVLREYSNTSTGHPASFTYYQTLTGDYNSDGVVDASDASLILKEYAENATGH